MMTEKIWVSISLENIILVPNGVECKKGKQKAELGAALRELLELDVIFKARVQEGLIKQSSNLLS